MYKILRSHIADDGSDPDFAVEQAANDLAAQVEETETEGWATAGGMQAYSRVHRGATLIWFMQAMTATEANLATVAEANEVRRLAETVAAG